jgi:hypothetical protein
MKRNQQRKPQSVRSRDAVSKREYDSEHVPRVIGSTSLRKSFQFRVQTSLTSLNVTFRNLQDLMVLATAATTGVALFESVKIRRIRIWSPSTSAFVPNTILLTWGSIASSLGDGRNDTVEDTSMSTKPAYVNCRPVPNSQAAFWHNESTGTMPAFILSCNANSIVQVDLDATIQPVSQVAVQNALASATAGQVYYRGLDGQAAASSAFITLGGPAGTQI